VDPEVSAHELHEGPSTQKYRLSPDNNAARPGIKVRKTLDALFADDHGCAARSATWGAGHSQIELLSPKGSIALGAMQALYEDVHCQRGDMENRIKECQGDLFADRTPAATMRADQLAYGSPPWPMS
jgi:hypothetical protein